VLNGLYPHDIGHYLGMDVHDTPLLSHNVVLQPGMVITVEPGAYVRRDFPIKNHIKAKEFLGAAVRIEDDVLITSDGPQSSSSLSITFCGRQKIGLTPLICLLPSNERPANPNKEPDAVLIIESNSSSPLPDHNTVLYVTDRDPFKEKWEGPVLGPDDAVGYLGVDEVMSLTVPGMYEYQLESHFEHYCQMNGGQRLAFVPVVAGGERACHIHYTTNELKLNEGELVLLDGGVEYCGYVSDITRTWPVNGRFTAAQRDLYEAVLRVKEACIKCCQVGVTLNYIHSVSKELLQEELKKLEILPTDLDGPDLIQ
uniref:Aminopeptidase P N-terminal domain-containing protein n=1 Tax=Amphimedon queenslandica TaxID=400682 RepID=A0A1X7TK75_AMPQE